MLAASRFYENNIEMSMLFQDEPAFFFCKFFKILSNPQSLLHTIESITDGPVG